MLATVPEIYEGQSRGDFSVVRRGLVFSTGQVEAHHFGAPGANQTPHWSVRYVELSTDGMLRFYAAPGGAQTSCLNVQQCHNADESVADTAFTGRRVTSVWRVRLQVDNNHTIVLGALSKASMHAWAAALHECCNLPSNASKTCPSKSKIPRTIAAIERLTQAWRQLFPPEPTTTNERQKRHHYQRTISSSRLQQG